MSQMLQASGHGREEYFDRSGQALSEQEVVSNLFIFTAIGFDTTVNTLAYGLVLLCRHPSWQDWSSKEIDSVLPASNGSSNHQTTQPYIQACMLETLSSTPLLFTQASGAKVRKSPTAQITNSIKRN